MVFLFIIEHTMLPIFGLVLIGFLCQPCTQIFRMLIHQAGKGLS